MTHSSITILHVDDDSDLAETAALFIERENEQMEITTATSARDGLALLADTGFDCIVSDYEMPGRNGIDFLKQAREDHPDLPFILYTGKGSEEVASEAISAGVTEYMQKEGGTDQYAVLANRIENSVAQYRAQQEADQMRQRLRELTESTTDCRWMFDSDWEELLFISGYEDVWHRPVEPLKANPLDFLNGVHPADQEIVEQAMERLSTGEQIDIEYRILQGDGEVGWVWAKGEPIYEDGQVVRAVGLTREITERKRPEQGLAGIEEGI